MDSRKLAARTKQPGHDQTFRKSELSFYDTCRRVLSEDEFLVREKPRELLKMFGGRYGIEPEVCVEYIPSGRRMYFEVKKQATRGNADERACRHHTVKFKETLRNHLRVDYHAFCTVFCESLATLPRYVEKHPYFFEEGHYFLWVDYSEEEMKTFLDKTARRFLGKR